MENGAIGVIDPVTERQITSIDQEKLPKIFADQVRLLEVANQELSNAEQKEKQAKNKVARVLQEADDLINAAGKVGKHTAEKKRFFGFEWTSEKDEIEALKTNLKELINHSGDSAEAQKKLAEVQSSLMESQTAILHVQKAHMEYQRQIANATKFVFGLSAYNMAISQSVYENITAILSNESPEKMGELAQQQLFLALDQIRNQESIITRINENDCLIEDLSAEIEKKQEEIDAIARLDQEQNRLIAEGVEKNKEQDAQISENARDIDKLEQQDEEQDRRLDEGEQKDREQDAQISENAQDIDALEQQDAEQDKLIAEGIEKDKEQDTQISENAQDIDALEQQDAEQDKLIAEGIEKDKAQDTQIANIHNKDEEQDSRLNDIEEINAKQDALLQKQAIVIEELKAQIELLQNKKGSKLFMYVTAAATATTLILAIIHFFI